MDRSTYLGLLLGIGGIFLGNFLEGGQFASLMQSTAFVIVITGTFGAVLVWIAFTKSVSWRACPWNEMAFGSLEPPETPVFWAKRAFTASS